MKNIILFGPPGAGKGTFAEKLCEENGWAHLNMGQIIREEIIKGSKVGNHVKAVIDAGQLVEDRVINEIAKGYILSVSDRTIVYDGYPRTVGQAKMIAQLLNARRQRIDFLINLECSQQVIVNRIINRKRDENDTKENATLRYKVYNNETKPVLDYLRNKGSIVNIDGDGSIEEVYAKIKELV